MNKKRTTSLTKNIISVRGAREHNLKNINLDIPREKLVVITGLSGSGKSSLAFDTIYAEGQRRYVESLSAYARQFLELMQKPDVDSIDGLSPAISIEQKTTSRNPRSTVGTVTEIYDYLRLLFARIGIPYSPATGLPIESQTVSQMVDHVLNLTSGSKIYILAPIVRGRKGEYKKELQELQKKGFQRVKINGEIYEIDQTPTLNKKLKHNIEVVVDRLILKPDIKTRLADSLETALNLSDGLIYIEDIDTKKQLIFSSRFACPVSGFTIDEIEPRLFSFNNPFGACPECDGLGNKMFFDPALVVPKPDLSLAEGAIYPWASSTSEYYVQTLQALCKHYQIDFNQPWKKLSQKIKSVILYGSQNEIVSFSYNDGQRDFKTKKPFEGVIPNMERRWRETDSDWVRDELSKYQTTDLCPTCHGYRLKPQALAVKINKLNISELTQKSIYDLNQWFNQLDNKLTNKQMAIAVRIIKEIKARLNFLQSVGLDYLNLARSSGTLSGGESQRIRLASQIGSGLMGVLYVLDEPSIGLHQRDNSKLLDTLKHLRDLGNTILVVEHDEDAIRTADYLVDMGPRAGTHGGQIVAVGTPEEVMKSKTSITAQYLNKTKTIPIPSSRREAVNQHYIRLIGAKANNLKNINVDIPIGTLTCVTGVSGGGKSTLIIETLYKALAQHFFTSRERPGAHDKITGLEHIDKVIDIDQSPIGRTPRSNPATYIGVFTNIRDWYAELPEAKSRGYKAGRFSFNVKGGRCESCQGDGVIKIEMHFLPDVYVQCDVCKGKRYNRETLEIFYKDKSIADILDMTVEEGVSFFQAVPSIRDKLMMLQEVGLGYIHIGQSATTLSGGEAQRVKLAKELSKRATGRTFYILDEPTTGLHFEDVNNLLRILHMLVNQGNTMVVIEHNLEVIKTADWIIDLGPEGGDKGGFIVAQGTPESLIKVKESYTGHYLKQIFDDVPVAKTTRSKAG
ncbi:MAG: excinuclease ABC subunit UvrA [Alphaproteobacteria bacterium]|nr:excinuclease ABC subunit UvrA [Alphaproteobacteria bacterium]